ncbi:hypothetical protein Xen7305DRAFT_00005840 [Xenococcus sp. PCC 7305]|nr:hypothetical protein Xen7305DRAFT_00005840 [Xenococcus sp. PCC 7305]
MIAKPLVHFVDFLVSEESEIIICYVFFRRSSKKLIITRQ